MPVGGKRTMVALARFLYNSDYARFCEWGPPQAMRVLIVSTNRCRSPGTVMPIGACRVAAVAEDDGHEARLLDLMFARRPVQSVRQAVRRFSPDVVGFSIRNIDNGDMCGPVSYWQDLPDMVRCVQKGAKCPVVLGGGAVSVMPEEMLCLTGADYAVVGEGELPFRRLLENLADGTEPNGIPGVGWLEDSQFVLEPVTHDCSPNLPVVPDYDRWIDLRRYRLVGAAAPIQTARGCPRRCIYCTYPLLEGRRMRVADPADAAAAIERLAKAGMRDFEFVNNVFNNPPEHAVELCRAVSGLHTPVRLQTTDLSPLGLNGRLLSAMKEAGFAGFGLTVESASAPVLEGLGKGFTPDDVRRAARIVRDQPLPCLWIYLLGGPGETPDTVRTTLDFAEEMLRPRDAAVFFPGIRVFPGTGIERIARREGLVNGSLLEPTFYLSPDVSMDWLMRAVADKARRVPGFVAPDTRESSLVPLAETAAAWLGKEPPLWQYTASMRRMLARVGL